MIIFAQQQHLTISCSVGKCLPNKSLSKFRYSYKQTVERFEHCFEAMIKLVKQLVFKGNSTENQLPLLNNRDDIKLDQTALGPEPSDEDRMVGEVSVLTYWKFFRAGASSITLFVLLWVMSSGSCK